MYALSYICLCLVVGDAVDIHNKWKFRSKGLEFRLLIYVGAFVPPLS
jgi:hypothetical protein